MPEEELASACLRRYGEERQIRLDRYVATDEARLNDAFCIEQGKKVK